MDKSGEANQKLNAILDRFIPDKQELNEVRNGLSLLELNSIDSMSMVLMIAELEKAFDVRIDLDAIVNHFDHIDHLLAFLTGADEA